LTLVVLGLIVVKNAVVRTLSDTWRPSSAPTSSVCARLPVCAEITRSVWLKKFSRFMPLL
jgi:hypothetical protein